MTTAIAFITCNRLAVLQTALRSVPKGTEVAVFDDGSLRDTTEQWLRSRCADALEWSFDLQAFVGHAKGDSDYPSMTVHVGPNLGVAGNSNRALRWFLKGTSRDHLMLCNDDIVFTGNAHEEYAQAHRAADIGLFCLCNFGWPGYESAPVVSSGTSLRLLTRMTGAVMSMTRALVESIGYFVPDFGTAGEEHCDFTYRADGAGFQKVNGDASYPGIDIENPSLRLQDTESSIPAAAREAMNHKASAVMAVQASRYRVESPFRPYRLRAVAAVANRGAAGIPARHLKHTPFVHGAMLSESW